MNIFYTPNIVESKEFASGVVLGEEESRHCVKVLRLQVGDTVHLADGKGGLFAARITEADQRRCVLKVTSVQQEFGKRSYRLHVAIAPTKNTDRFEWFLEKATEAGIDEITPLICVRSERRVLRTDRLFKRITAAMKQSLQAYHPILNEPQDFSSLMERFPPTDEAAGSLPPLLKCIAHCGEGPRQSLKELVRPGTETLVLIGPEGDFTPSEIDEAGQNGFVPLDLGERRLRTETAGLAVCFEMAFLNRG
ncbi:MAG TPA: 16S rRNA (uracil(1498)-N(3))-methyltransferase [Anseongella sp.]